MKVHPTHYDVIVIGGGPAGTMAAGTAAKRGKKVLLLEKNADLGEKLKITGGGRCNITNYELDNRALLEKYDSSAPFLHSPFSQFSVKDTFTFFERRKLPLVTQARNRVFPKTENAKDVQRVMKDFIKKEGVEVKYQSPVKDLQIKEGKISAVDTQSVRYTADSVILSTGGVTYPETGSTGDGFAWLRRLGHQVESPSPDIVPLRSNDFWIKDIAGTTLSFMKITFFSRDKKAFSKTGKILFTHFGLSSPLILNSSKQVKDLLDKGPVTAEIDCFPDTDEGSLDERMLKLFAANKNKKLKNILPEMLPKKIAEVILDLARLENSEVKVNTITTEERKCIRHLIKHLPLTIDGLMGFDRAVIADGGVPLEEIDTKEMRSKVIKNLFLVGDVLHINRPSGGYSLQLCWTTGYVAGMHV
ncbi:aminoacetone oxidase family FAD-binding enzyme [Patescibacteria group bacterium]|nr:aminoacetone oxidase family FAD-binding enzyme [Patescibacteria group bacterium]